LGACEDGMTRNVVMMIVDEAILNECGEARQMVWFADVHGRGGMISICPTVSVALRSALRSHVAAISSLLRRRGEGSARDATCSAGIPADARDQGLAARCAGRTVSAMH
jgi:hypothetical protein